MEPPPLKRLVPLGAALVVVALAAVLRLEGLGRDGLWFDETVSLGYAQQPLSHPGHWNNGMALFHTILHGWMRLAGESEAALRFPSAVFGIAAVALLIALVRRVNGWTAALAAGLMLALAWRHVYYSQEARTYSLFIMLAILTTLLLVRLLERPHAGRLVAYGVALAALTYSHYQWVFVVVFHNLVVLASRRRVGWGWLWLHVAVVAAYVPQIVLGLLPHTGWSPHYIGRYPGLGEALWCVQDAFGLPLQRAIVGPLPSGQGLNLLAVYLLPLVVIAGVAACLVPLAVRLVPALKQRLPNLTRFSAPRAAQSRLNLTWLPLLWFAATFVLPFLIAQTGAPVFRWRYMAGSLPVYCWFIGLAVAALPAWWLRVPAMVICIALTMPAVETMKNVPMREDWRGCAAEIAQQQRPGDRIVVSHFRMEVAFRRYYRAGLPITGVNFRATTDEEIAEALAWDEPPKRVWLVVSHNPTPVIIDYFKRRPGYKLVRDYRPQFLEIALFLFEHVEAQGAPDN